jgi:hypothetical protein
MNRLFVFILLILIFSCEYKNKNNVDKTKNLDTLQKTKTKEPFV